MRLISRILKIFFMHVTSFVFSTLSSPDKNFDVYWPFRLAKSKKKSRNAFLNSVNTLTFFRTCWWRGHGCNELFHPCFSSSLLDSTTQHKQAQRFLPKKCTILNLLNNFQQCGLLCGYFPYEICFITSAKCEKYCMRLRMNEIFYAERKLMDARKTGNSE